MQRNKDHNRGTGGYSRYNRAWTTRTWDSGIADELDITIERKKEIRQAISIAKQKIDKSEEDIVDEHYSYSNEDTDAIDTGNDALVEAVKARCSLQLQQ